jgi:hypothetical protein
VKEEIPSNKKEHSRERETGQTTCKEVWFYLSGQTCQVGRIKSFFPVYLPWMTACYIHGSSGHIRLSASGSKGQRKRKSSEKP